MCFTEKESLLAFVAIVVIVILLWVRNYKYDRVLAALLFIVSLIQLVEYLVHRQLISTAIGGQLIFLVLWLQPAVVMTALYVYLRTTFVLVLAVIFDVVFLVALIYSFSHDFEAKLGVSGHLEWTQTCTQKQNLLGSWGWLYIVGIFLPFFVLEYYEGWRDIGLWILLGVLLLTMVLTRIFYPGLAFSSMWCYSAVAVAFTAWLIGAFHPI